MTDRTFDLLDTRQLAAELGKHPQLLSDWRHQRRGPRYIKIGRHVRYRRSDVEAWLAENTVETRG